MDSYDSSYEKFMRMQNFDNLNEIRSRVGSQGKLEFKIERLERTVLALEQAVIHSEKEIKDLHELVGKLYEYIKLKEGT